MGPLQQGIQAPERACVRLQLRSGPGQERTQLKYAVEVQIPRSTPMLGLLEPLLERVVFQDLPQNLAALKARVELLCSQRQQAEEYAGVCPGHLLWIPDRNETKFDKL